MEDRVVTVAFDGETDKDIAYPRFVTSKNEELHDLSNEHIYLGDHRGSINFKLFPEALYHHIVSFVAYSLPRCSDVTVYNRANIIKSHLAIKYTDDIEDEIKKLYKEIVFSQIITPEEKSVLRKFYEFSVNEGHPYFDDVFYEFFLEEASFGTNKGKGRDVLIPMKNRGCLTAKENPIFIKEISKVDYTQLSLTELHGFISLRIAQLLGARDVQVRNLKVKHFHIKDKEYLLDIPRAKQRGRSDRKLFKRRIITTRLGRQIEHLIERMNSYGLGDISDYPLLCTLSSRKNVYITKKKLSTGVFHSRMSAIQSKLSLGFTINNRRLRKTFCSTLVSQGTSLKVIADLMDHSDLQQLEVYYRQTYRVSKKINEILIREFGYVLDVFHGRIIKEGEETLKGQDIFVKTKPRSLYKIGSCGSNNLCTLSPPLSCYGCPSVELFEDAEHGEVLESLTEEAKHIFGEQHMAKLLEHGSFLAISSVINKIEEGDYE
ncbi:MAG: tyrosine-type recombinase/integrase [Vibrio toranzoniae]|uniref:tyrosine-type recombinase/integrase n=1 Tax=Vibrio toranzoniae TaxID=1194427 RepID=UPI003F96633C